MNPKLASLDVHNFTVFSSANIRLSPQLNILIGENGTGKTHLLKVAYSVAAVSAEAAEFALAQSKSALQIRIAEKLTAVFRPETLGRLARRHQGRSRCEITCRFEQHEYDIGFSFATPSKSEVTVNKAAHRWLEKRPVYLPTRELLSIYSGFLSLYEGRFVEFDETWRDTCVLLGQPAVRGPKQDHVKQLLAPLEKIWGGHVELDKNGRFYLTVEGEGRMEIHLVAEGWRKIAMIARLIVTGSLLDSGYLFWDEPEANLNPKLIRLIAATILALSRSGIQVIIATHSLFLMRELDILLKDGLERGPAARFIGLQSSEDGVQVHQGDTIDEVGNITSLEEELRQNDRYLETEC